MRAIFYKNNVINNTISELKITEKEILNHLKVIRVRPGEKILILNGQGLIIRATVVDINKKAVNFKIESFSNEKRKFDIDLAICLPKKVAFEEIVNISCQIGVKKIIPILSEYSSQQIESGDRLLKIMKGATQQANNPFLPELMNPLNFNQMDQLVSNYDRRVYFCSKDLMLDHINRPPFDCSDRILLLVGPEGGLSIVEESEIIAFFEFVHLDTYILRTKDFIGVAFGHIFANFK